MAAIAAPHPGNGIIALSARQAITGDAVGSRLLRFDQGKTPYPLSSDFHCHWVTRGLNQRLYAETLSQVRGLWTDTVYRLDLNGALPSAIASGPEGTYGIFAVGRMGEIIRLRSGQIVAESRGRSKPFRGSGRPPSGTPRIESIHAIAWGPSDDLYLADGARIRRIGADGVVRIVAEINGPVTHPLYSHKGNQPRVWSLAVDPAGRIFAAVPSNGVVLRIDRDGKRHVLSRTQEDWATTGVSLLGDTLFLLDSKTVGNRNYGPRVRTRSKDGVFGLIGLAGS
ncbi:MAG TPA: hypothetical protein PLX06_01880 [Fimbriimonadaceae bacterium]|nr:hypothetical protein [Fimbriimonadaceae bacterium]